MTKDVLLTIAGLHAADGESDDPVEVVTPAQYYLKNGKHYVLYEEVLEGLEGNLKSTLKISKNKVELMRVGAADTRMIFEKDREHVMIYRTPMGPLTLSVYTKDMELIEENNQICVYVEYELRSGEDAVTDSSIRLQICPKECKKF